MFHTLKILERMIDGKLRKEVEIGREQLEFMKIERRLTDGIYCLRQIMGKFREMQISLHMVFIDLEKACNQLLRQEVWRGVREKRIPEKYAVLIQEIPE